MDQSKDLYKYLKNLFKLNRSFRFIKKNMSNVELKIQHHLRFIDKSNFEKAAVEYRCQRSKCGFKISFLKCNRFYMMNTLNLKHSHAEPTTSFELENLKKSIERMSDLIFEEYFVSRINQQDNTMQLLRPCLILEDMKQRQLFTLNQLSSHKKYKVQLKKKFDNVIQNLRKDFKAAYPNVNCLEDSFQLQRQNKSCLQKMKITSEESLYDDQTLFQSNPEEEDDQESTHCSQPQSSSIEDQLNTQSQFEQTESESSTTIKIEQEVANDFAQDSFSSKSSSENTKDTQQQISTQQSIKEEEDDEEIEEEEEDFYECTESLAAQQEYENYHVDSPINFEMQKFEGALTTETNTHIFFKPSQSENINNELANQISNNYPPTFYTQTIINSTTVIFSNYESESNTKLSQKQQIQDERPFGYYNWFSQNNSYY